jgi:hypothetical protein
MEAEMTLGAVAEITVKNAAALELPVIHRVATAAMKERFRLELSAPRRPAGS